jgi:hypothetical protein
MAIGQHVQKALAEKAAREQAQTESIGDPVETAEPPATPAMTLSADQFQQLLAAVGKRGPDTDLASAITQGMAAMREPIPEQKQHHGISEQNPFGELKHPSPSLKCDFWWGVIDDKTKNPKRSGYEIDPSVLTVWERMALNLLQPGTFTIKRLDKVEMPLAVGAEYSDAGVLRHMVIAFPQNVVGKGSDKGVRNMVPDLTEIVRQITGCDVRRESLSDAETLRLMAEHRAKRYDTPRAVAA